MKRNAVPRWLTLLTLPGLLLVATACHRVIIDSGLEPTTEVYHEEWNMAYANAIYPAMVDGSTFCEGLWSRIETRHSFLNGIVGAMTFGIITPMDVKVVCAETGATDPGEQSEMNEGRK